jgi:hypothetical protein
MLHVAVLVHRHAPLDRHGYWLRAIVEYWQESGVRISVIDDPGKQVEADLAILHVDLTVVPDSYLAWIGRFAVTINGAVADISKREISRHQLRREDRYDGPVIVKTDRNCAGDPELRLASDRWAARRPKDIVGSALGYLGEKRRRARRRRRYGASRAFLDYPVFPSRAAVPEAVWSDDELVVERFLAERYEGRYGVRTWLFLGDQDRHALFYSHEPVIKSHNIVGFERLGEVPEALRARRRELRFDFGKFDYAMVDGQPVLFDANRTPTIGDFPKERYLPLVQSLAGGLGAFL